MAVKIRLRRIGKKKEAHYRVVVADSQAARGGRFIETIGYVNPRTDPPQVQLNEEQARKWLARGAQPTDTVKAILVRQGVLEKTEPVSQAGKPKTQAKGEESPAGEVSGDAGTDRDGSESPG
jgi:small subunit ribosomal protein S16